MTLSACLIVKNEERLLPSCLDSLKPLADEVVIVDTGSTDATLDIITHYAEHMNIVQGTFRWVNDFAAARNVSLDLASQDWCLWIDADEQIPQDQIDSWQKLTEETPDHPIAYNVNIINYLDGGSIDTANNFRLWSNHFGVRFQGKIHEQVIPSFNALDNGEHRACNLRIDHYGYQGDQQWQQSKRQRNKEIIVEVLDENPDDHYTRFTLAQEYTMAGEFAQALREFQIVERHPEDFSRPFMSAVYNNMAYCHFELGDWDAGYQKLIESVTAEPRQVKGWQMLSHYYYKLEQWQWSKNAFEEMLHYQAWTQNNTHVVAHDIEIPEAQIAPTLKHLNTQLNELVEGDIILHPDGSQHVITENQEWIRL